MSLISIWLRSPVFKKTQSMLEDLAPMGILDRLPRLQRRACRWWRYLRWRSLGSGKLFELPNDQQLREARYIAIAVAVTISSSRFFGLRAIASSDNSESYIVGWLQNSTKPLLDRARPHRDDISIDGEVFFRSIRLPWSTRQPTNVWVITAARIYTSPLISYSYRVTRTDLFGCYNTSKSFLLYDRRCHRPSSRNRRHCSCCSSW